MPERPAVAVPRLAPDTGEVYREILRNSSEAIAIIDPQGRYLEQNAAHRDLVGYADAELAGKTPALHMGEETFATIVRELAWHDRYRGEVQSTTRDGRTLTLELSAFTVRGADGEPLCHVGIKRDVTERRRAEDELQRRYEQLGILYRVTDAVGRAGGMDQIYDEALGGLERALGARRASVLLFDADGVMRFKAWRGISDGYRAAVDGHSPWTRDTVDPRPITIADAADDPGLTGALRATVLGEGIRALGFFPLVSQGRLLGKFMLYYDQPHPFTPEDVQLAQTIAGQVALAIARKADEQALREQLEERRREERVQRFLAEAGNVLASSLDVDATLAELAGLCTSFLADFCVVDVVEDGGSLRRVAAVHVDPRRQPRADDLRAFSPLAPDHPAVRALASGQAQRVTHIDDAYLPRLANGPAHLAVLRRLAPCSALAVPMLARGRIVGVITLFMAGSGRTYGEADVHLAEELGRRAALAVDNARLYQAASQANQAKGEFLAVMSHELRTPLNAILGYTDLLLMGVPHPLQEGSARQVQRIGASARHLLQIIEQILAFSRLEAGREEAHPEDVELCELVRETAALIQPLAEQKGLRFDLRVPEDAIIPLRTDPGKLRQILLNLLSNAIKFTEAGVVGLCAQADAAGVRIAVRDTGVGLAPEHLERVFEPFWQADHSRTRQAGGTGLGLSVTRQLAQLLGGEVSAESRAGQGTTFTVTLPTGW